MHNYTHLICNGEHFTLADWITLLDQPDHLTPERRTHEAIQDRLDGAVSMGEPLGKVIASQHRVVRVAVLNVDDRVEYVIGKPTEDEGSGHEHRRPRHSSTTYDSTARRDAHRRISPLGHSVLFAGP